MRELKQRVDDQRWAILAIYHRERMLKLASSIDELGDVIALKNDLDRKFNEIESLTESGLRENWGVKSNQFPDEGLIKYKTFLIYLRNWSHDRDAVHAKVRAQSFEGQQTNTRQDYGS